MQRQTLTYARIHSPSHFLSFFCHWSLKWLKYRNTNETTCVQSMIQSTEEVGTVTHGRFVSTVHMNWRQDGQKPNDGIERRKKGIIRVYESIDMACFRLLLKVATKRPKEREKEQPRKASRWQQYRIWPCRRRAAHIWYGRFVYRGMPFREHGERKREKNQHECVRIKATRLHGFGYRVRYK